MSNFKRVLSSEEIINIVFPCDWSKNKDQQAACIIAREIEQAVLAKLAEQEPVAWHTEDHFTDRSATTYDPEVVARWEYKGWPITPLYAHPTPSRQASLDSSLTRSGQLDRALVKSLALQSGFKPKEDGDLRSYVYEFARAIENTAIARMKQENDGWRVSFPSLVGDKSAERWSDTSEVTKLKRAINRELADCVEQEPVAWLNEETGDVISDELAKQAVKLHQSYDVPLYKKINGLEDGTVIDEGTKEHLSYLKRYQKWRRGEDKTMDEAGLTPKQIGESLDWLIGFVENHIPDTKQAVILSLSIDTKEFQEILQTYLDDLKDWQLVPIEPTDSMRKAGVDLALNVSIGRFYTWDDYMRDIYNNMLAAAPKYTGDK